MRGFAHLRLFGVLVLSVFMTGCLLPLPHTQVVRPECEGFVFDIITGKPISNATVVVVYESGTNSITHTDSTGYWTIPGEKTWHAVVFAVPPTGYSLLPRFDGLHLPCEITIEAEGYDKWEWTSLPDEDTINTLSKPISEPTPLPPFIDSRNVQLTPEVVSPQ